MTASTVDEYLAGLPDEKRAVLERLRAQIHEAAPEAVETIAYGMPGYRLNGRYFVGFGATKDACSIVPGRAPLVAHIAELAEYRTWKGTINFAPERPLPPDLVASLVRARLAEFAAG